VVYEEGLGRRWGGVKRGLFGVGKMDGAMWGEERKRAEVKGV